MPTGYLCYKMLIFRGEIMKHLSNKQVIFVDGGIVSCICYNGKILPSSPKINLTNWKTILMSVAELGDQVKSLIDDECKKKCEQRGFNNYHVVDFPGFKSCNGDGG